METALMIWGMSAKSSEGLRPPFGEKLSELRRERGWSQAKLAEMLSTSRGNIDYYENRAQNPTLDFITRAAAVFGIAPTHFVENTTSQRRRPGPKSKLERRFELVRQLPTKDQEIVIRVIDGLLTQAVQK